MVISEYSKQKKKKEQYNNIDNNIINNTKSVQRQTKDDEPKAIKMAKALQKEEKKSE